MIRRTLYRFMAWVQDYPKRENEIYASPISIATGKVRVSEEADIDGMRFIVMLAEGGTIVQMRTYDRRRDESNNKTYVIPDTEQDIAHRIGQIVAMELLKQ